MTKLSAINFAMMLQDPKIKTVCYHCGDECEGTEIHIQEKKFCCQGCKTVYEIINKVDLCEYYDITKNPGLKQNTPQRKDKFAFLDDELIQSKLIHFKDGRQSHLIFYLPQMHCSSCIWILEHLSKIEPGVIKSQVNFLRKEVSLVYEQDKTSLRKLAELLTAIGYEPHISFNDISTDKIKKYDRTRIFKIGVAGFCFGNIMMLSFPEYFSFGNMEDPSLARLFSFLNLGLALPVFFYSASEFFVSAWKGFKQKFLNIDAPIALAVLITFARSLYEILSGTGAGYLDSMSGIVFFMLVGRFFQDKTYNTLTFNRDYTSYFPLGVTVINESGKENQIPISKLKIGDRIKIFNQEIVPADAILFMGKARIDYSFVTGESLPVEKGIGEIIYAGGRQTEGAIELEVVKEVSQSYLTQLWNNDNFKAEAEEKETSFIHKVSRYFTLILFAIAISSAVFWLFKDPSKVWDAVTAVLIVACPCALLLSATFTNGSMIRVLQNFGFYPKNANVLERISNSDHIVFDKTGTITLQQGSNIFYEGQKLNREEEQLIRSLANQSNHPLSRAVVTVLPFSKTLPVKNFMELKGKGISGTINGYEVYLGSSDYILGKSSGLVGSRVYIRIGDEIPGHFEIKTRYRSSLKEVIKALKKKFSLSILSGDNETERLNLKTIFGETAQLLFNRSPHDKLNYIKLLQSQGKKVIMVGDGLNDAGALKQSDVGIAVSDNINNFSPACDAILDGNNFEKLPALLNYCRKNKHIIIGSFILSVLYNIVGLFFAVRGELEPVIAAILMPVSSISIILFTTGLSALYALKLKKKGHVE
jgi:P-type Cu+ transporter